MPAPMAPPPDEYVCPITGELLQEPVTLSSGKTYERAAILEWFEYGNTTCPLTRKSVDTDNLAVNTSLQRAIQTWHKQLACTRETDTIPLMSTTPLQAFSGHFLLPAPQPLSTTSATVPELVRAIRGTHNTEWQEHLVRQLLMAAADCETKRKEIAACGAVPLLVEFVLGGTEGLRWQSAEVLSYLSLDSMIRTSVLASLHAQLVRKGFESVHQDSPEETVEVLRAALRSGKVQGGAGSSSTVATVFSGRNKEAVRTLAIWALWVLSIWDYLRGLMAKRCVVEALVRSLSSKSSCTARIGAARLVRSLAMLNSSLPLLEECHMVPALVFLLQAGGKLERVAACTALCNLAFSPQFQHYNNILISDMVLEPLLQLLQGSCLPQQRSAARMLKALASGSQRESTVDWLLSNGAVSALVDLLDHEDRLVLESVVGSVATILDAACHATRLTIVHKTPILARLVALVRHKVRAIGLPAARVLAQLTQLPAAATYCAQPSLCRTVMEVLQCPEEERQHQAALVLLNVCKDDDALHLLLLDDPAPLRALVCMLSSSQCAHQAAAAQLIQRVAMLDVNRPYIAKVGGVHALLDVLNGKMREHHTVMAATATLESLARAGSFFRKEILGACEDSGNSLPDALPDILFAA